MEYWQLLLQYNRTDLFQQLLDLCLLSLSLGLVGVGFQGIKVWLTSS